MECPKCGFSQPQDTFCARCGVHIENYEKKYRQPQKLSWFWPFLLFAASLSFVLFYLGVFQFKSILAVLTEQEKSALEQSQTAQTKSLNSSREPETPSNTEPLEIQGDLSAPLPEPVPTETEKAANTTPLAAEAPANTKASAEVEELKTETTQIHSEMEIKDTLTEWKSLKVQVKMTELSSLDYEKVKLATKKLSWGDIEDLEWGPIKGNLNELNLKPIVTFETLVEDIKEDQPMLRFNGLRDPETGQAYGLTTKFNVSTNQELIMELLVELPDLETTPIGVLKKTFTEGPWQEVPKVFFIKGLLPYGLKKEGEAVMPREQLKTFNQSFFRIFNSQSYLAKESHFVIFFEFQNQID